MSYTPASQYVRTRSLLEAKLRQGAAKGDTARFMVRDILQFHLPITARYKHLDVLGILRDNCQLTGPGLEALIHALSILERYGKNLLRSERPAQWRVVRLSNSIFKREVDVVKGSRNILRLLGYTKAIPDGLAYADECLLPEVAKVAAVTADILMLRHELNLLIQDKHNQEKDFFSYIPMEEVMQLRAFRAQQNSKNPEPTDVTMMTNASKIADFREQLPRPPSYEDIARGAGIKIPNYQKENYPQSMIPSAGSSSFASQSVGSIDTMMDMNLEESQLAEEELCDICGTNKNEIRCTKCDKVFCPACDKIWHNNPKRRNHAREPLRVKKSVIEPTERRFNGGIVPGATAGSRDSHHNLLRGSPISQSQERGASGSHSFQPTISGARLPPTLTSRNISINDNEWSRKANRMASELTDIKNADAQKRKLNVFLSDLNVEAEKYRQGIRQVQNDLEKPSLVAHFEEKLSMIEALKQQLKVLVGYTDPVSPPRSSVSQNQVYNHHNQQYSSSGNNDDRYSFGSVSSQNDLESQTSVGRLTNGIDHNSYVSQSQSSYGYNDIGGRRNWNIVPQDRLENGTSVIPPTPVAENFSVFSNQSVSILPSERLEEPEVPVANLIDLSSSPTLPSVMNTSIINNSLFPCEDLLPLDLSLGATQPPISGEMKSALSPDEESVDDITQPKITTVGLLATTSRDQKADLPPVIRQPLVSQDLEEPQSEPSSSEYNASLTVSAVTGHKRLLPSPETPAKHHRPEAPVAVPEISTEFEHMNIDATIAPIPPKVSQPIRDPAPFYNFEEPMSRLEPQLAGPSTPQNHGFRGGAFMGADMFDMETNLFHPLSPGALQRAIKNEENRLQTTQFLDWIRAGHASNYLPTHVKVAVDELEKEGNLAKMTPNDWLEGKWHKNVAAFIEFVKTQHVFIPPLAELENAILSSDNNHETALKKLAEKQDMQIADLSEEHGVENARKAFVQVNGDHYHAACALQNQDIQDFLNEFKREEGSSIERDDLAHIRETFQIAEDERRSHALQSTFSITLGIVVDTCDAIVSTLHDDMRNHLMADIIEAAINFPGDADGAMRYLDNECMICTEKFPQSKITCLPTCGDSGCKYCLDCLEQHLAICITNKNLRDIVCPVCSNPKFNSDDESITNFFNHIDVIVRRMENKTIHEIFQGKLRDFTLMRMPSFRWCSHCSGGFQWEIERENQMKMLCPFCKKATCYQCKKNWEAQHEGITCEQFQQWKESNDPEFQAAGLARHLKENGIDCPDCKFRYALAKGGCMHFKCTQCSHEFCSGCYSPFKHGRACNVQRTCPSKGLHAHHPRDCLFFLRDSDPQMLQRLLRKNRIHFNTGGPNNRICQVMEQKEIPTGMKDDICGREVKSNNAGLCRLHYNEYLVNLVNTHGLDPADEYSVDELKPCLMRVDKVVPQKKPRESENAYRQRLLAEVKKLPLIKDKGEQQPQDERMHNVM